MAFPELIETAAPSLPDESPGLKETTPPRTPAPLLTVTCPAEPVALEPVDKLTAPEFDEVAEEMSTEPLSPPRFGQRILKQHRLERPLPRRPSEEAVRHQTQHCLCSLPARASSAAPEARITEPEGPDPTAKPYVIETAPDALPVAEPTTKVPLSPSVPAPLNNETLHH